MACDVGLSAARQQGLSAALFAPGWVYEEHDKGEWQQLQRAFWGKVQAAWPPGQPAVTSLPLHTCFNRGCGQHMHVAGGRVAGSRPWYHLGAQQLLPADEALRRSWAVPVQQPGAEAGAGAAAAAAELAAELTDSAAYEGGSCLQLSCAHSVAPGGEQQAPQLACCSLFDADVACSSGRLRVSCVAGGQHAAQLVLLLHTAEQGAAGEERGSGARQQQLLLLAPAASCQQLQGLQGQTLPAAGGAARLLLVAADQEGSAAAGGHVQRQQLVQAPPVPWQRHSYDLELPAGARRVTGCSVGLLVHPQADGEARCTALLGGWRAAGARMTRVLLALLPALPASTERTPPTERARGGCLQGRCQ
jgi:hypothetical protein